MTIPTRFAPRAGAIQFRFPNELRYLYHCAFPTVHDAHLGGPKALVLARTEDGGQVTREALLQRTVD